VRRKVPTILKKRFLFIGIAGCLLMPLVKAAPSVQVETLLRSATSWDGQLYQAYPDGQPELSILKMTFPANSELSWHTHPMPNAAYVVSGELTVQKKETGEKKTLTAGQVLPEMVNQLHRGFTGDQPVELIVFYAGVKGMPLSQHE
jgi:quercetin dioxygenase-like cupin family protein